MIREFFYLQKSDRKVILTLLGIIVIALGVIFFTGGEHDTSNGLVSADTVRPPQKRDTIYRTHTTYVHTKVIYRDRPHYSRRSEKSSPAAEPRDSFIPHYPVKIKEGEHVILNSADTTMLRTVPGIGPYFARKIVQYGERLGGYVNIDQLEEIDGFPLESKKYFVIQDAQPQKLNINQLSLNELKRHPYINFYRARAIEDYRRLHGPIKSLNDLRLSKDFPPEVIERLMPYVAY